nr:MAG TPA: hypothetical protein [Caudoviricetes sp.]
MFFTHNIFSPFYKQKLLNMSIHILILIIYK